MFCDLALRSHALAFLDGCIVCFTDTIDIRHENAHATCGNFFPRASINMLQDLAFAVSTIP